MPEISTHLHAVNNATVQRTSMKCRLIGCVFGMRTGRSVCSSSGGKLTDHACNSPNSTVRFGFRGHPLHGPKLPTSLLGRHVCRAKARAIALAVTSAWLKKLQQAQEGVYESNLGRQPHSTNCGHCPQVCLQKIAKLGSKYNSEKECPLQQSRQHASVRSIKTLLRELGDLKPQEVSPWHLGMASRFSSCSAPRCGQLCQKSQSWSLKAKWQSACAMLMPQWA